MNKIVTQIRDELRIQADTVRSTHSAQYFKLEPGTIDTFIGVTVPKQRLIARRHWHELNPSDVIGLLQSVVHEERLTALLIWILQYKHGDEPVRQQVYDLYLRNTTWINNWDLVDTSARDIVGSFVYDKERTVLKRLSMSKNIWERRIAMIATFYFIGKNEYDWTLQLAEQYLPDTHHYIQKATGWALREVGKKNEPVLRQFLDTHAAQMPRTMLRYAIERLDRESRQRYLVQKA